MRWDSWSRGGTIVCGGCSYERRISLGYQKMGTGLSAKEAYNLAKKKRDRKERQP